MRCYNCIYFEWDSNRCFLWGEKVDVSGCEEYKEGDEEE